MIAISGNPVPHNQFYSVIRGRMFLAMLRIPESCLAVAIEMICVSHLRPCLELDNTTHNGIDPHEIYLYCKIMNKNNP